MIALPPPPWVIAHRGDQSAGLENTLAACAAAPGIAHMVEVDCQLTGDGELVVFHDWTLERLAGLPGQVEAMKAAEITAVDLLAPSDHREGGRVSRLEEVLAVLPKEYPVNLELKRRGADSERLVAAVAAAIREREQVLLSSFDRELLTLLRHALPGRPVAPIESRHRDALLAAAEDLDAWSVHAHRRIVDRELLERSAAAGRPVLVYTVDDPDEARGLLAVGVSGLFTDRPAVLRAALERP